MRPRRYKDAGRRRACWAALLGLLLAACFGVVAVAFAAQKPAASDLQIEPGVGSLSTAWSATSTSGLKGFRVRWRPLTTPSSRWGPPVDLPAKARSYTIDGLDAAVYEVRVRTLIGTTRRVSAGHKKLQVTAGGYTTGAATALAPSEEAPKEEQPKEKERPKEKEQPKEEKELPKEEKELPKEEKESPKEKEPPHEELPAEEPPVEEEAAGPCALYGSPSGNDANKGGKAAPLKTVPALLGKLKAGQTGCLATGSYEGFVTRAGQSHGSAGSPVTITSTDPLAPATIAGRVVTTPGADYLTFTHLDFTDSETIFPSVTIGSAHTTWTDDDVTAPKTICFETVGAGQYGPASDTLIERDRVHNCGQPFQCEQDGPPCNQPPQDGYYIHGLYDLGERTTVRNSYFYEISSKGILLRGSKGSVIEHNVIDGDGSGVLFGDLTPKNDTVQWNLITNSHGPCKSCANYYGVWSFGSVGAGNSATNNDIFGNVSGNVGQISGVTLGQNIEVDPKYVNAAAHDYTLELDSPALGYGPE
ncbi:MAG TPA: hypothetical protein VHT25_02565 [Solirubrobacteraceae bacterium]|nr:hypothetical protein [Solirubrobacteraceae bacterium]